VLSRKGYRWRTIWSNKYSSRHWWINHYPMHPLYFWNVGTI